MGVIVREKMRKKGIVYWLDINHDGIQERRTLKIDFSLKEKERRKIADIRAAELEKAFMTDSEEFRPVVARNFVNVWKVFAEDHATRSRKAKFKNVLEHFKKHFGPSILTTQLSKTKLESWRRFLEQNFNGETPKTMWDCTMRVINWAVDEKLMKENPAKRKIKAPKVPVGISKAILSVEELIALSKTPMPDKQVCAAFFFCCFTGLGRAEIVTLKWTAIDISRKEMRYKRGKGETVIVPMSKTAIRYLPEKKSERVFPFLPSDSYCSRILKQWVKAAKIDKSISWYCARHSYAMIMLEGGADLRTVQLSLGHTEPSTTAKYTKHMDKLKRAAADRMPDIG